MICRAQAVARIASVLVWLAGCTPRSEGSASPPPLHATEPDAARFVGAVAVVGEDASVDGDPSADSGPPAEAAPPAPPPLEAPSEYVSLEVAGFRPAVVSLPLGATGRRPVVVALHGNFNRPEWQCEVWRGIVGVRAFVLCPRGVPRGDVPKSWDRWEYGTLKKTEAELDAALIALGTAYPDHVDPGPVLFTGFSLGGILGALIVKKAAARYPRVVLIEGGEGGWSRAAARAFRAAGGERILFACGQASCQASSRSAVKVLGAEGIEAKVVYGRAGHTYDGKVAEAIVAEWAWLIEGDVRW